VLGPELPGAVLRRLEAIPALELITYEQAVAGVERSDVVHRPQQVFTEHDLRLLHLLGDRIVIGQQDLIAYRNPAYHDTAETWQQYRRVTRLALTVADRVVFFSEHAMRDAVAEDLLTPGRCDVVGIGADLLGTSRVAPAPVPGVPAERDLLVCLGADYQHKNRPFAIELLHALRARHGWSGCLVLAGPHVPLGSSRDQEQALLSEHPDLMESVIDVGVVDESHKAWLYERARAVVYPTLYEGFGLIPFEAAFAGAPCLFAPQASLVELAGPRAAALVAWDAQLSADAVMPLLADGPERTRQVDLLLDAARKATWSKAIDALLGAYAKAIDAPHRAAAPRAWQELERERFIASLGEDIEHLKVIADDYQRAYHELHSSVALGLPLVADGGLLSHDEQRGLMRVASRRALHNLMLAPIGLLGRLGGERSPREADQGDPDGAGAGSEHDA
jgi:glycosyltransferase involved in cell wall biosynthesis